MAMRFATKMALCLAFSTLASVHVARADSMYQPYYADDRDYYQFAQPSPTMDDNVTVPATPPKTRPVDPTKTALVAQEQDAFYHYNNELWLGAGSSFLNYKESVAPIPDSERGWLPSVDVGGSYMTLNKLYFSLDGSVDVGDTHYNGAAFDSNTNLYDIPEQGSTGGFLAQSDAKIGQGILLSDNVMIMPYGDLGFRYWDRNLGENQEEYYHNFDALAGMMLQIAPSNRWMISLYGSGGTTFGSRMTTTIAAAGTNGGNANYDLGSSGMEKAGGKLSYGLTPNVSIFTGFDYEHFHYGVSQNAETATYGADQLPTGYVISHEPGSRTSDTAVTVGVGYHFR